MIRDLSCRLIRVTLGAITFTHGRGKLNGAGIAEFAPNSLAKRGPEPALPLAHIIYANETISAMCLIFGLFTRFWAASPAIELAVITSSVFFPHG